MGRMINDLWSISRQYLDKFPTKERGIKLIRYGLTFLFLVIFFIFDLSFSYVFGLGLRFILALFIVIVSAWFAGFGPGIMATVISGVMTYVFLLIVNPPLSREEHVVNIISLVVFFISGFLLNFLIESQRKSERQRSEFIGIISHELKTPLTIVKGYAQMLELLAKRQNEKRFAEYALRIDQQINYITVMINEMLDIAKIESGRLTYHDEVFSIDDLVKEVIADQQITTTTHKIRLSGESKNEVRGDRYRIGQVIANLINNAVKYSPNAREVLATLKDKNGGVLIAVKDFGLGIEKHDQNNIFQPFFRAGNVPEAHGTGVGLYISSQIVARHKGKLWVESKAGKGSTFNFWLPVKSDVVTDD